MIPRRAFLKTSASLLAGPSQLSSASFALAASPPRELTLATRIGVKSGGHSDILFRLLSRIETACKGSLKFRFISPSTQSMSDGALDGYVGLISADLFAGRVSEARLEARLDALSARLNAKVLIVGATGVSLGLWSKAPVSGVNDFAGVDVFANGPLGGALEALGARSVQSISDLASQLKSGRLFAADCGDGAECVAQGIAKTAGFCAAGIAQDRQAMALAISHRTWHRLRADERHAIMFFADENLRQTLANADAGAEIYRTAFSSAYGTAFYKLPPELFLKFATARAEAVAANRSHIEIT